MKVIIAGSRTLSDMREVAKAVTASGFEITEVVSGMARGIDRVGARWAEQHGIPVKQFHALWVDKDGAMDMAAGKKRNRKMAEYADALIAVWDGESTGTKHMMQTMGALAKPIYYVDLSEL